MCSNCKEKCKRVQEIKTLTFTRDRAHCKKSKMQQQEDSRMSHIFIANLSHSADAWVGVGLIGVYFVWMLYMAMMRVKKGDHLHH